jgi:tetratricopeptide (TPR) repeat protein/DNA-binding CsgD family transcriptional regulator
MDSSIEQLEERLAAATDSAERIALLNDLVVKLYRADPPRALQLAEEMLAIADSLGDRRAQAMSLRAISMCQEALSEFSAGLDSARQAHSLYVKLNDRSGIANTLISIGILARSLSDYTTALASFNEARVIFDECGDRMRSAAACNNIGTVHESIGNYSEAIDAYLTGLRMYEEEGEELNAAIITSNIASVYYYLNDVDKSFDYHSRGLAVFQRLGIAYSTAISLGNISSIYKQRGDYNAALESLNQALAIFQKMQERRYEATTLIKLGTLYELQGESKAAMTHLRRAATIAQSVGSRDTYVDAQLHIGEGYYRRRDYRRAIAALEKGLESVRELKVMKSESDLRFTLAQAYAALGEYAEAYEHSREYAALSQTLFGQERQRAVAEMQARFDVERAEREREMFRLKSEHLEEMMEQRSKELTAAAMHLVQKNSFLQKLRKDTVTLSKENPLVKGPFTTLLRAIDENLHDDNGWQRFEQEFQLVHHDFMRLLSQRYPNLTPGELKVCALLKVNLSNKEIANLLSVSIRNVESHRYWIRKKMELSSDVNLAVYLAGM